VPEPFSVEIERLQPSQLYISQSRLARLTARVGPGQVHRLHPVPVARLGDRLVLTDGHSRTFAAWRAGQREVLVAWEEDDLDWEAYHVCVEWCVQEGITSIAHLADRVVSGREFERLWLDRCRALHRSLGELRAGGPQERRHGGCVDGAGPIA
jgi:hypothetical protein